jgi:hypothetical protein
MKQHKPIFLTMLAALIFSAVGLGSQPRLASAEQSPSVSEVKSAEGSRRTAALSQADPYSYQGQLVLNGTPYNGACDFEYDHWDALSGGLQLDTSKQATNVPVQDGLFSLLIDSSAFSIFTGDARWLEISVRCPAGSGGFTHLSPRQELTPAPYAHGLLPNSVIDAQAAYNLNPFANGLSIVGGNAGLVVSAAASTGIVVTNSGDAGMFIDSPNGDGIAVLCAGSVSSCSLDPGTHNGLEIGNAEDSGILVVRAEDDGYKLLSSADDGAQFGDGGLSVFPSFGLYVPPPGVPNTALLVNTANSNGEWALDTPDKIRSANVTLNTLTLYAQVDGSDALARGDLVAVSGLANRLANSPTDIPLVRLADENDWSGVIGVVEGRLELKAPPGKEDEGVLSLYSAPGSAKPGEYVALTVFGVAQVKLDPSLTVAVGERLTTASLAGHARSLQSRIVDGMAVTEGAPIIGILLAPPNPDTGLAEVFVTLR